MTFIVLNTKPIALLSDKGGGESKRLYFSSDFLNDHLRSAYELLDFWFICKNDNDKLSTIGSRRRIGSSRVHSAEKRVSQLVTQTFHKYFPSTNGITKTINFYI